MTDTVFGEFKSSSPILGHFDREYNLQARWFPNYIDEFPSVLQGVSINWKKCKFTKDAQINVSNCFGVYCFAADIGGPFPNEVKSMILYVGKASDQYLSERYQEYLTEANSSKGRVKVVNALRKYKPKLTFWWCELPSIHVEVVERHLLMCYEPPANDQFPKKEKHWGKAFIASEPKE